MRDRRDHLPLTDFRPDRQLKRRVRDYLDGECIYCGCKPKNLTVDHIIPINHGGTEEWGNLAPACLNCNRSKGNANVFDWWLEQPFYSLSRGEILINLMVSGDEVDGTLE